MQNVVAYSSRSTKFTSKPLLTRLWKRRVRPKSTGAVKVAVFVALSTTSAALIASRSLSSSVVRQIRKSFAGLAMTDRSGGAAPPFARPRPTTPPVAPAAGDSAAAR